MSSGIPLNLSSIVGKTGLLTNNPPREKSFSLAPTPSPTFTMASSPIPSPLQNMAPVLYEPNHQAILYFGWWRQVVPNAPDPISLIDQMKLIHNPTIKIFGKEATSHRSIGFFSDQSEGYQFSGQLMKSQPLSTQLREIMTQVNQILARPDSHIQPYNGILVNRYENGTEYISPHSDAENELSPSGVFALSMGATRDFHILAKSPGQIVYCLDLTTNQWIQRVSEKKDQVIYTLPTLDHSVMLMAGPNFQKLFKHAVPTSKIAVGPRISWTWRSHKK